MSFDFLNNDSETQISFMAELWQISPISWFGKKKQGEIMTYNHEKDWINTSDYIFIRCTIQNPKRPLKNPKETLKLP